MSKETKKAVREAEKAFFKTCKYQGSERIAKLRNAAFGMALGMSREEVAERYNLTIKSAHSTFNNACREPSFVEWVGAIQRDMQDEVQQTYVEAHEKRKILSEVEKKEELTEMFYLLKGSNKLKDALSMIQELNKMDGHYAPTKTEVKDTTDTLDDAELDAAIAAELAQLGHRQH